MKNYATLAHWASKCASICTINKNRYYLFSIILLLTLGTGTAWGADATLSFADTAQRTSFSTTQQVWEQNGITFTNAKASSTSDVADYAKPVRLYASSSVTVECSLGNITQIVFDCNSSSYATAMKNSIGTVSGATVSVSSDKVTVTFTTAVESFTVAKLTAQVRLDAITVTYEEGSSTVSVTSVTLNKTELDLIVEAHEQLTATVLPNDATNKNVSWSSDNTAVATVSDNGLVTAVGEGKATITVTTEDGNKTATCTISVTAPAGGDDDGDCEYVWELVTDASKLKEGDEIVIAAKDYNYALSTTQNNNNRGQAAIIKSGTTITFGDGVQVITLQEGVSYNGTFVFYTGSGYLYAAGANSNNYLKTNSTTIANGDWSISVTNNTAFITACGNATRNVLKYNTSGLFSCYASDNTQKDLVIYKKVCGNQATPTLTASTSSLAFGNVTVNSSKQLTFTLSGSGLTANAALALSGTNASMFTVSPTSVTPSSGTITNQTITVTYKPTAKGNHSATLTISSTGAEDVTVSLSGTGVAQTANYTVKHYQQNLADDNYTLKDTETLSAEANTQVTPEVKSYTGFTAPSTQTVTVASDGSTVVNYQYTRKSYTLTWDVNGGNALTGSYTSGSVKYGAAITKPADPTREGHVFKGWHNGTSIVTPATTMPASSLTYTAQWTPIYTITWLANGEEFHKQENAVEGTALDLPDSEPDAANYACDDKVFVGWTANPISGSKKEEPDDLFTTKTANVENAATTYYAVFATADGGGTQDVEASLSFASTAQRTSYSTSQQVWTQNGITLTNDKASSTSNVGDYSNPARFYKSSSITIEAPGNIKKVVFICSESKYTTSIAGFDANGTTVTVTQDGTRSTFTTNLSEGQVRLNSLTVTYTTSGGTSYSDYVTACTVIPDPVWGGAVIDNATIAVNCGETSPMNSAATISFPAATNNTLTYDITVTASNGFLVSTNKTDNSKYGESVTVSPVKTGTNAGTITQKVYVRAVAPAMSSDDFDGTITISGRQITTQTIDVTADVTCTGYTLTLVDRGVSTEQPTKYYAGETIDEAPADPEGVCTDPIHYVFDGWAAATVSEGATEYTKVIFPYTITGNTKFYAVYRYVEEGSGDGNYYLVENDLGSQWAGEYLIVSGTKAFDGSLSSLDVTGNNFDVTISNKTIEATDEINQKTFTIKSVEEYYTIQSKSGKYIGAFATGNLNNNTEVYDDRFYHTLGIGSPNNKALIYSNKGDGVELQTNGGRFRYYTKNNQTAVYLYKKADGTTYYTTSPVCGPHLAITEGKEIYVTGGNAGGTRDLVIAQQKVSYKATRLQTSNGLADGTAPDVKVATNGITVGGVVTSDVKVTIDQTKEQQTDGTYTITGTITVQYQPSANNKQEDIQVQLAADYNAEAKDNFTVHARSLPSEFVIVAKSGDKWYVLNGDMNTNAANPANGQVTLDNDANPTKATYAPCNTIYTFDGLPNTGDRTYVRFQGTDGAWLWAASGANVGIQNNVLKTTPEGSNKAYNWKLYTEDNITYRFGNANSSRQLTLNGEKFGMYASGVQDIRILPYVEKCLYNYAPSNLKVSVLKGTYVTLTWDAVAGATKYQYSTDATNWIDAGSEPTVTINGLTSETNYTYYIRAYHADSGVSQECFDYSEVTFTTADCDDVPTDITYTADLNSITVSWTAAAPTATIKLFMDEEGAHMAGSYPGAKSPYKISGGLTKNTTYYIQILADGTCASPIIPVKTEDVKVDIVEWQPQGIIVDINTDETIGVTLENEVSYGSGSGSLAEDLFFSKYFEGSGSLKMIAIYNGTGKDVNLSEYRIDRGSNGDATNISKTYDLSQLGVIKQGQEIIFYSWPLTSEDSYSCSQSFLDSKAQESGLDANPRWILCDAKTHSGIEFEAMDFSGDDPLLFYKGNTLIDVFGVSTAAERPSQKTMCDGRSDNSWSANEVTNMDYGKTTEDFPNGEIPYGVNVDDETITAYTARVIMFRKNTVVSGKNAVTKNTTTFATFADEWEARQVCRSGDDGDLTCAAYQELGTFDYSEYYTKYESMGDEQIFDAKKRNEDGTVIVEIPNLDKQSCRNIRIKLTNSNNGEVLSDREYKVPIMITTTQGTDGQAFLALQENLATVEIDGNGNPTGNKTNLTLEQVREICKTCDVVIRDNAILTKAADDAADDHPEVRDVYVYQNSSLIVPAGTNYTINNLSLRRKQDTVASLNVSPDALKLPESAAAPISLDFRLSAESWHWFTLPFDCNISEVTWIDGSTAQYNVDWFLMTYDGEKRAATQAGGCWKAYTGTTIRAGEGFILAINGNINNPAHTYELRFPMSKEVLAAEGTDKTVDVRAWGVETNIRPNHKGWNLVGNPYLAYYQRNNITNFEGLRLGQLVGPDPQTGYWEQTGEVPYVVVPVGAGWVAYEQVLASDIDLLPFTAYFVQVGKDGTHNSDQDLKVSFDHTKLQLSATPMPASIIQRSASVVEEPVIVGVSLTNAKGESDKTSLIIDDQYTDEYEMNADFFKWFGDYYKYYTKPVLYTIGADQGKRAFNAISEDLATQPISLGMYAAQAGNYTFSLDLRSDLSKVQEVWLYDATQDTYTNLLQDSYTFQTAKTESAGRFFLSVKMAPKVSTDINNVTDGTIWATTQDHTIIVNGLLSNAQLWIYDATGKLLHSDQTQYFQHSYSVPISGTYFVRVQNTMQTQTIKVVVE